MTDYETLHKENEALKARIHELRNQESSSQQLESQVKHFVTESQKNLADLNNKLIEQNRQENEQIKTLTLGYEALLKKQIALLGTNKALNAKKEEQEKSFEQKIGVITKEYETKIKGFETKIKTNVKQIQDLGGNGMIKQLLNNQKFQAAMVERGCSVEALKQQTQLDELSKELEDKEEEIKDAEERSARLDEELQKTHELIDTMKELMDNMVREKENIMKQNAIFKEKVQQTEALLGKLLGQENGANAIEEEDDEEGHDEDEDQEEEADQE